MKATETSRNMRITPDEIITGIKKIFIVPPLINLISKWPATILAARRTDRVIGRIKFLTSSITTISGISKFGVPLGTKCERNLLRALTINPISINIHTLIAMPKVSEILLEGVNT